MRLVYGLRIVWIKWNKLSLCKESSPRDFLVTRYCYKEKLQRLGLESLELRRLRCDLLYTYKIVFGLTSEAAKNMFTFTSSLHSVNTRGHAYKLYPHNNRINVRKHFFCERVITPWNSLPAIAEDFCSLSSFKCFLNSTDLSMYVSLGF